MSELAVPFIITLLISAVVSVFIINMGEAMLLSIAVTGICALVIAGIVIAIVDALGFFK